MINDILYIAGPMRRKYRYNFAVFSKACEFLRAKGYQVVSPHEIDLAWGFDPDAKMEDQSVTMVDMVRRDVEAISLCHTVVTLPGWRQSTGARAEVAIAKWLKKPVYPLSKFQ